MKWTNERKRARVYKTERGAVDAIKKHGMERHASVLINRPQKTFIIMQTTVDGDVTELWYVQKR